LNILVVNGPNLNLLGSREPEVYGNTSFTDYLSLLKGRFAAHDIHYFQSNQEGELIDTLHQAVNHYDGIVLNAGGYSHTSVALADAVAGISLPVVTVHISNIYNREPERHKELLSKYAVGGIFGLGLKGYDLAIEYLVSL
jgi:3-dehydroquinate dehydratase-2